MLIRFLIVRYLGVLANYVTTEQSTGAVHTAPSHGADDFYTGTKYKLDQRTKVDEAGHLQDGLPEYDGKTVFQANAPRGDRLKARGASMAEAKIEHSYPNCWRCHNPVIFRATEQWFISIMEINHCSVARKITGLWQRQQCGYECSILASAISTPRDFSSSMIGALA